MRKKFTKYRITVENESRLTNVADFRASVPLLLALALTAVIAAVGLAALAIVASPLKNRLPGYLKESERDATEAATMRLDSLRLAFDRNSEYLANIIAIADTGRVAEQWTDSVTPAAAYAGISVRRGHEEEGFVARLRDSEKYALSVIAPLSAEDMMFFPVSEECVVRPGHDGASAATVIVSPGSPVATVADGTVVDVYYSPHEKGYTVIVQHARGFMSRYSRLAAALAGAGDRLPGGQVIGLAHDGISNGYITVDLWQNGVPLPAADFLDPLSSDNHHKPSRRNLSSRREETSSNDR